MWKVSEARIIVALDFDNRADAERMADRLDPALCRVKVGKELFTHAGPDAVHALRSKGYEVFLDLKFHDIPNTVAGAVAGAAALDVWMVDVHALGGAHMLKAARQALAGRSRAPFLIGVTLLTSLSDADLPAIGIGGSVDEQALRLAHLSRDCGLDGVVCSAREAARMRAEFGPDFLLVTPGIRPPGSDPGDQQRTMTPAQAIRAGSSHLVIGRAITQAADPTAALRAIHETLDSTAPGSDAG